VSYCSFGESDTTYNFNGPQVKPKGSICLRRDPEMKRKRRIAAYKALAIEGKLKSSMKNGFRWLKTKYVGMRSGWGSG